MRWAGFQEDVESLVAAHVDFWEVDQWSVEAHLWQDDEYQARVFTSRGCVELWGVSVLHYLTTLPAEEGYVHLDEWRHEDTEKVEYEVGRTTVDDTESGSRPASRPNE